MAAELEDMGMAPEQVDAWLDAAEDQLETAEADDEDDDNSECWEENERPLAVFTACHWTMVGGGAGIHYAGIEGPEIESVMRMQNIPSAEHPAILQDIRFMESVAKPLLNRQG